MARLLARAAQVRFADSGTNAGERGQTNAENKLFVGGVPAGCGDKELRSLFSNYGDVQDVYILASKVSSPPAPSRTQRGLRRPLSTLLSLAQQEGQRGCAFVRFASPQSCAVAIEALHGKYAMKAGELPLVVRYADPPKSQRGGGLSTTASRFPWPGAPPMWSAGPPPPGWPLPWGLGGMGMTPYAPWMGIPGVAQPASGAPNYHPPPPAAAAAAAAAQHLQEQQQAQQPFQACAPQQHPAVVAVPAGQRGAPGRDHDGGAPALVKFSGIEQLVRAPHARGTQVLLQQLHWDLVLGVPSRASAGRSGRPGSAATDAAVAGFGVGDAGRARAGDGGAIDVIRTIFVGTACDGHPAPHAAAHHHARRAHAQRRAFRALNAVVGAAADASGIVALDVGGGGGGGTGPGR